ncbi:hypothetical protein LIER_31634 [Lithospermum erythrorhizon]|uniref:Reverse transcriptase zinc-binding domain-containing protein n=1 Tax=Lithospermum erythrorhizon TaxID=34254 RepID=A0AAV3RXH2_LITER
MNMALFVKQGWRILTRQASLLFKILKGRYFHRSSFLNAKVGANPSFGWRSILEARKLLQKGVRWRIGDGISIVIWKEPWVPCSTDFHMADSIVIWRIGKGARWVSQLLRGGGVWNKEAVDNILDGEDLKKVMAIPLSHQGLQDKLIWRHTRCGQFLTSSGYKCAGEMKRNGKLRGKAKGEGSTREEGNREWKELWKMQVPSRVKQFIWRCIHDILPTKIKLLKKGVLVDPICVLCSEKCESLTHLLLECSFSCRMWYTFPWGLNTEGEAWVTFKDWWKFLLTQLEAAGCKDAIPNIACTLWSLWKTRNGALFDNSSFSIDNTIQHCINLAHDFQQARGRTSKTEDGSVLGASGIHLKWQPPQNGFVKLNCYVGWPKESNSGSLGVVARGESGDFIEIESDSKQVVNAIRGGSGVPMDIEVVVADIIHLTKYVKHSINNVAHCLAHWDHKGVPEEE